MWVLCDVLDWVLIDLVIYFWDVLLVVVYVGGVWVNYLDMVDWVVVLVVYVLLEWLLCCIEVVLVCREVLVVNVKLKFVVDVMVVIIGQELWQ